MAKTCIHDPLTAFLAHYSHARSEAAPGDDTANLPVEERLKRRIIDGDAIGLEKDLTLARDAHAPIDIINTILLDGMKTVGELFGSGQMQLPFVLQSAEVMKKAVAILEPFMDRLDSLTKGTIVLATVKGDVHDIGKNLVDIILTNNGYRVVNLGIKVGIDSILHAAAEHHADAIGMSGLLVKSTLVMRENLGIMEARGLRIPVVLGGAALTRRFVEHDLRSVYSGRLAYAGDAFDGLAFMEALAGSPPASDASVDESPAMPPIDSLLEGVNEPDGTYAGASLETSLALNARQDSVTMSGQVVDRNPVDRPVFVRRSAVAPDAPVPQAPFLGTTLVTSISIDAVFEYLNPVALIRGQWQVRRGRKSEAEDALFIKEEILPALERLKAEVKRDRLLTPAVAHGYFPCNADGNDLVIFRPRALSGDALHDVWPATHFDPADLVEWQRFSFPRQSGDRLLCIADYFRPIEGGVVDVCAFHAVTMGARASEHSAALFAADRYQDYLYFHGLSVESAEALAEYWHRHIRIELGIAGSDADDIRRLFSQGYQGSRYSFGYPACPNLDDQRQLFELLRPERIGITLTEECHLVPEQSTTAIIVHHPEARYFMIR